MFELKIEHIIDTVDTYSMYYPFQENTDGLWYKDERTVNGDYEYNYSTQHDGSWGLNYYYKNKHYYFENSKGNYAINFYGENNKDLLMILYDFSNERNIY